MKKSYTITADEKLIADFREVCKEQGVTQALLVEAFMRSYIEGNIEVHLRLGNKNTITIKE